MDFVAERALAAAADFEHGWRSGDRRQSHRRDAHLRLGPGLTPSGDDLLAGS
jgi:hypothetical protein